MNQAVNPVRVCMQGGPTGWSAGHPRFKTVWEIQPLLHHAGTGTHRKDFARQIKRQSTEAQMVRQKTMRSEGSLRRTIEYEEAVFLLALKRWLKLELQTINEDLRGVKRISRDAMLLANKDLERYNSERIFVLPEK
jgi:hypothetical protein